MRSVNGALVIVIAFVLLYVAVTGKLDCLVACWKCLTGSAGATGAAATPSPSPAIPGQDPRFPTGGTIYGMPGKI